MNYGTCKGCLSEKLACPIRFELGAKIKGLGITSIKWKCKSYEPAFQVGQPVIVPVLERDEVSLESEYHHFDAYVVRMNGRRVVAYVPEANREVDGNKFEFKANGYLNLSVDDVMPRKGEIEPRCEECGNFHRVEGHDEWCHEHDSGGWYRP